MPTFTDGTVVHQADLNLLSAGINNLSTYTLGAVPPRNYVPEAAVYQLTAQSIPNTTDTLLSFDGVSINNDNMWVSSQKTQLTVQTPGTYNVEAQFGLFPNLSADIYLFILVNGTVTTVNGVAEDHQAGFNVGDGNLMHCNAFLPNLAAGTPIYLSVWQNSGVALNTMTGRAASRFYCWRISN